MPFLDLPEEVRAGDYWKLLNSDGKPATPRDITKRDHPGNLTGTCWMIAVPRPNSNTGEGFILGTLISHTVREHEDGTISVRPGDGSSNSILIRAGANGPSWHGYVNQGVLEEC